MAKKAKRQGIVNKATWPDVRAVSDRILSILARSELVVISTGNTLAGAEESWAVVKKQLTAIETLVAECEQDPMSQEVLGVVRFANRMRLKADWGFEPTGSEVFIASTITGHEAAVKIGRRIYGQDWDFACNNRQAFLDNIKALPDRSLIKAEMQIELLNVLAWLDPQLAHSGSAALTEAVPTADGPFGTSGFRWKGKTFDGMTPKVFALVAALFESTDWTASFSDLAEPVWGDASLGSAEIRTRAPSLGTEATQFFEDKLPFRVKVSKRNSRIQLLCTE